MESALAKKSLEFSVELVGFYRWLASEKKEFVMSKQVLRSGTSIGANIHEANYGISKADFIAKMQIALKECAETEYWFEILKRTGYMEDEYIGLIEQNEQLKKMLISTLRTSKGIKEN